MFDVLIHNGGSIFHDFQRSTESLPSHSYSLDALLKDFEPNRKASDLVWNWLLKGETPTGSLTSICQSKGIPVLMFTVLGGDFWQLFDDTIDRSWARIGTVSSLGFATLCNIMKEGPFHFINMGSAVVMPEVFTKAVAVVKPKEFRADVVDFLGNQYRPLTRVAKYGRYYHSTHVEFLKRWLKEGDEVWR